MLFQTKKEVSPWSFLSIGHPKKSDSPRSHGRITTVIALFLMALLAGGLFFQNTALKAKEREKARQEEMVKRQQADKARALKKAKKETGVRQPMSPGLPQSGQKSLPKGSTPSTPLSLPCSSPFTQLRLRRSNR